MTAYEAMRIVKGDRHVEEVVRQRALDGKIAPTMQGQRTADLADAVADQVPLRARAVYGDAEQELRKLLDLVATSLELNPRHRGRTTLVLVSGGFVDND